MSNLEPRVRHAFKLRHKGLSYQEIAAEMGIKPATVERQIMFARKSLKAVLASAVSLLVVFGSALYIRGREIHREAAAGPQYMDIPELYEARLEDWRVSYEQWRVADSLWQDSVTQKLIPATSIRPMRPIRPLPPEPAPEFNLYDRAAIEVYGWIQELAR